MTGLDWTAGLPLELKVQHYSNILELTDAITMSYYLQFIILNA